MGMDNDAVAERQARVERMTTEFRDAQSRRFGKPNNTAVESKRDATSTHIGPAPLSHSKSIRLCSRPTESDTHNVPRMDDSTR